MTRSEQIKEHKAFVVLHNIRSAYNVGAIFRTSDAAGISKLFLTGYTPTPVDCFNRKRDDIAKTALGAEDSVPWEYITSPTALIRRFKQEHITVVGVEQAKTAKDYKAISPQYPVAFLFGNEVRGISKQLRQHCDTLAYIPMHGEKESLNVSVAVGVFLFHVLWI